MPVIAYESGRENFTFALASHEFIELRPPELSIRRRVERTPTRCLAMSQYTSHSQTFRYCAMHWNFQFLFFLGVKRTRQCTLHVLPCSLNRYKARLKLDSEVRSSAQISQVNSRNSCLSCNLHSLTLQSQSVSQHECVSAVRTSHNFRVVGGTIYNSNPPGFKAIAISVSIYISTSAMRLFLVQLRYES